MSSAIRMGLGLLAGAIVFGGFFILNLRSGNAAIWGGIGIERRANPVGFWLVQAWLGAIAGMALLAATLVLLGISPP